MHARTVSVTAGGEIRWSKFGDLGLCLLLSLMSSIQVLNTYIAIRDGEALLALHQGLVCGAMVIMAGLPLIRRRPIARENGWRPKIIAVVGSYIIVPLGALPVTWKPDWLLEVVSVGFVLAQVWIIWALLTLKRSFSVFPEARHLVTHGPYGIVRHPLYFAYFFTYTLIALPRFGVWAVLMLALGIAAETYRSRKEERVLRSTFPEYESYARRVRAFIPFNRSVPLMHRED